jgi:esterase/lipase superfamily enzyme
VKIMRFYVARNPGSFVVFDAAQTTVAQALPILQASRFKWCVLTVAENYFVLPFRTVLNAAVEARRKSLTLAVVLGLRDLEPSPASNRAVDAIELPILPPAGSTRRQFVFVGTRKGNATVSGLGSVEREILVTPKKKMATDLPKMIIRRPPAMNGGSLDGDSYSGAGGGDDGTFDTGEDSFEEKLQGDRAAAPSKGRPKGKSILSFGGYGGGKVADAPKLLRKTYDTVNVFYATDREPKATSNGSPQYSNKLAAVSRLSYGICTVTIPENHKTGRLEAPSIWRFQIHEDPNKHFTLQQCSTRTQSEFFNELSQIIARGERKAAFVFIHGYNVAFEAAAKRTAQLSRDMRFPGAPILYSWASAASTKLYAKDEETVALTVDRLAGFLKKLAETSGASEIHLIAHSMGNRALINALKALEAKTGVAKAFKQVVLTAPDVPRQDAEVLIQAANAHADRITLYASKKDKALLLSRGLHDNRRLGFVYDEYPFVIPGLDSIDASSVKTDFLAHSFFSDTRTVLGDLAAVVLEGKEPSKRFGLKKLTTPTGPCWEFD